MVNIYFTFSPCYLVLTLTISLCLSPILGFNNSYWLYLQSLPFEVAVTYKTVLSHILLNSYAFLYLCIYVFLIDMILSCNILVLCFRREMALSWHSYFLFLIFRFDLEVICSHAFNLWYIWKDPSWENLCYNIWYLNRNNYIVKTIFYRVFIVVMVITKWCPLITPCYSPFLRMFIHLNIFQYASILNGCITLVIIMILHSFLKFICVIDFNSFFSV